jgi:hypothetical protein
LDDRVPTGGLEIAGVPSQSGDGFGIERNLEVDLRDIRAANSMLGPVLGRFLALILLMNFGSE